MRTWVIAVLVAAAGAGSALAQDGPPSGPPPGDFGRGGPHGRLFISPIGEPFRGTPGGPAPQDTWFDGADANGDGTLDEDEMAADAARFFAALDLCKDGEIDPDDIERYETVLAPEIRTGGFGDGGDGPRGGGRRRGRGGPPGGGGDRGPQGAGPEGGEGREMRQVARKQGAAHFGYLDYPEPVTVADRNLNRGVDPVEFEKAARARFAMLDTDGDGRLEKGELPRPRGPGRGPRGDGKGERRALPAD